MSSHLLLDDEKIMTAHLLFVDDEKKLPEYYIKKLRACGFNVETCPDASTARLRIQDHEAEFQGFILDIMMPEQRGADIDITTGLRLYRWVREHCPETPIVILTNRYPEELFDREPNDRRLSILWKPGCTPQDLVDHLAERYSNELF